jgi:hypothetical protein
VFGVLKKYNKENDTLDLEISRKRFLISSALPDPQTRTPIAALINFCKLHLNIDIHIKTSEKPAANGILYYTTELFFENKYNEEIEKIAECQGSARKYAKRNATILAIQRLKSEADLLNKYIDIVLQPLISLQQDNNSLIGLTNVLSFSYDQIKTEIDNSDIPSVIAKFLNSHAVAWNDLKNQMRNNETITENAQKKFGNIKPIKALN